MYIEAYDSSYRKGLGSYGISIDTLMGNLIFTGSGITPRCNTCVSSFDTELFGLFTLLQSINYTQILHHKTITIYITNMSVINISDDTNSTTLLPYNPRRYNVLHNIKCMKTNTLYTEKCKCINYHKMLTCEI